MAASSSHPNTIVKRENPYPYPTHVIVANFVSVKLSGRDNYGEWKIQILCLLVSHGMMGFINGEFLSPDQPDEGKNKKDGDTEAWRRSDALVKGWIIGSLSEQTLGRVVNILTKNSSDFTAKQVWDELHSLYCAPLLQQPPAAVDKEEERKMGEIQPARQQNSITQTEKSTNEEKKKQETEEESRNKAATKEENRKKAAAIAMIHQSLYEATLRQSFKDVDDILKNNETLKVSTKITVNGNTALHVAVGTTKNMKFIEKMLGLVGDQESDQLSVTNEDGSTLLHVAAIVGNTKAAIKLVERKIDLLFAKDNDGRVPLFRAHSNMHTETYLYLLKKTYDGDLEKGTVRDDDMHMYMYNVITSQDYDSAKLLIDQYPYMHWGNVLIAIAQNFPRKLTFWETILHKFGNEKKSMMNMMEALGYILYKILYLAIIFGVVAAYIYLQIRFWKKEKRFGKRHRLLLGGVAFAVCILVFCAVYYARSLVMFLNRMKHKFTSFIAKLRLLDKMSCKATSWSSMPSLSFFKKISPKTNIHKMGAKMHDEAIELLKSTCLYIKESANAKSYDYYYNNAVLEATRENAYEVVETIVSYLPDAIRSTNEDGHNIIQYAVINRSEMVYNLLYQMSEHQNVYKTIEDPLGNNLLHLAARLAPPEKLNPISGAALQIQRELQWFKEVERFVSPIYTIKTNNLGETPQMLFTKQHKDLVSEGEKWIKTTAESYTITAALITTITFAAAITVPGGSNQDTGIPVFSMRSAFTVFAISVAISLFTSVTSLLMFLSILTARFAEQDFLYKLPTKLIIGLATLFISTTAMIVAFGATLYLVFGKSHSWILAPIAILTCLPVSSFVFLQYPLIKDLVMSTYFRKIFGKKSNKLFY